jgi:hypothetical protein
MRRKKPSLCIECDWRRPFAAKTNASRTLVESLVFNNIAALDGRLCPESVNAQVACIRGYPHSALSSITARYCLSQAQSPMLFRSVIN